MPPASTGFGRPDGYMPRQVDLWVRQWEAAKVEEMPAMDRLGAWLASHIHRTSRPPSRMAITASATS